MGVTLSKHKVTVPLTEKKSLAVQTDMEQSDFTIIQDPRSPSTDFQRTPIQVPVLKEEVENMDPGKTSNIRNKHLEKVKNLSKIDSPLNIKMKFVEHATIVYDQIERINSRKLMPKSRKFVTVIESKCSEPAISSEAALKLNQKPYLETNLDELEPIVKSRDDDKKSCVTAESDDPVQKAIDQMTENLNDLKMLTLTKQKKPAIKVNRQPQAKEIEVITIDDTPKKSIHQEKVRTPFVEIQSRIPVSKNRKTTDLVKKKLNVDLDENNENAENVLTLTESKSSNITFMEPKPAHWDTNKTLLF